MERAMLYRRRSAPFNGDNCLIDHPCDCSGGAIKTGNYSPSNAFPRTCGFASRDARFAG